MSRFATFICAAGWLAVLSALEASAEEPYDVAWIVQLGTVYEDRAHDIATDDLGNVFVGGYTSGELGGPPSSRPDAFVLKYSPDGILMWADKFGSPDGGDIAEGIETDNLGNVFIAGYTYVDSSYDPSKTDGFLTKYDTEGNPQWTRQFGTSEMDLPFGVAADNLGNAFVGGQTIGSLGGANAGLSDAFLSKYDTDGDLMWSNQIGTSKDDLIRGVAVDGMGNVFVGGTTSGNLNGPDTSSGPNAFLAKYDNSGDLLWLQQIDSPNYETCGGITTDHLGNMLITGYSGGDAFVSSYDTSGNLLWKRQLGTNEEDRGVGVAADSEGNVFMTGITEGNLGGSLAGERDLFLAKFDNLGSFLWAQQMGSPENEFSEGIATDDLGNVFIGGYTEGNLGGPPAGQYDVFALKYAVPEPSSIVLLATAALGVLLFGWRRRRPPSG